MHGRGRRRGGWARGSGWQVSSGSLSLHELDDIGSWQEREKGAYCSGIDERELVICVPCQELGTECGGIEDGGVERDVDLETGREMWKL